MRAEGIAQHDKVGRSNHDVLQCSEVLHEESAPTAMQRYCMLPLIAIALAIVVLIYNAG